jgi:hypothetical protein
MSETHFDDYSDKYDSALADSLSTTGEDKEITSRVDNAFASTHVFAKTECSTCFRDGLWLRNRIDSSPTGIAPESCR